MIFGGLNQDRRESGCGGCGQQPQQQAQQPQQPRISIPIPGLSQPVGSGSVVAGVLSRLGVQPCGGCGRRANVMNGAVGFRPAGWV